MLLMMALKGGWNAFVRGPGLLVGQLYLLKLHLDKTALDVFRMLPDEERDTMECAVTALKKRFMPADIEELRGLEFHYRSQGGNESIEQLGISIQQLGRKAFPLSLARTLIVY